MTRPLLKVVAVRHPGVLIGTLRRAPVHLTAGQVARQIHDARLMKARELIALSRNGRNVAVLRRHLARRRVGEGGR